MTHTNYQDSLTNNDAFWRKQAARLDWYENFETVSDWTYKKPVSIKWFLNGKLNVTYNCIDRHLVKHADKVAFYWEADDPNTSALTITYQDLHDEVCRLANALKELGVKKGDRVTIYMPMIPQATYAMLACARIGAIHSVIFGGFSAESIAGRIKDCKSDFVITADEGLRGNKKIALKKNIDAALEKVSGVRKVLCYKHTNADITWNDDTDIDWQSIVGKQATTCEPEVMDAEDPLFILYTSGSTGTPKGILHTTAGYLTYVAYTHEAVFNYKAGDVYWCTADVGWITGHSYIVYGPLTNGATSVLYEGIPSYPDMSRHWQIIDKYKVNIYYTAPTAIRAMMASGNTYVEKTNRKSLKLLGSVGEPINPEAWKWYHEIVGEKRCPVVDTWWQTETGGILISPLYNSKLKPGSATKPLSGIEPCLLDRDGKEIIGATDSGILCMKRV